jgi:hypothetical protein
MGCRGVSSINGLRITATGWMYVDGEHVVRRQLKRLVERRGGILQSEFTSTTELVLMGELLPHQIQDDREGGVDALEELSRSRRLRSSRHVHLVS